MKFMLLGFAMFLAIQQTEQCEWEDKLNSLKQTVGNLARQVMLQQMYNEDVIRNSGNSGIVNIRLQDLGPKTYQRTTYTNKRVVAVHTHANNARTLGMGEFVVQMNGVEFKTRHNDYKLKQAVPADRMTKYNEVEDIEFPIVPPTVSGTVEEQIDEMREYFKAFQDQNVTHRDYRPYFKSVLCYLEGAWTLSNAMSMDEPFSSDRHQIDAANWLELQQKVNFGIKTGRKNRLENLANLPTSILSVEDNEPVLSQWNYRILCQPLKDLLPTNRLRLVDDYHVRMGANLNLEQYKSSRAGRFSVAAEDEPPENQRNRPYRSGLLDDLMSQVPGKDGPGAYLEDGGIGGNDFAMKYDRSNRQNKEKLNTANYHRIFQSGQKDAMGAFVQRRGYHDESLFFAMTNQSKVAPAKFNKCVRRGRSTSCEETVQRWTYAIPLELIYMTPLLSWNPHGIALNESMRWLKGVSEGSQSFPLQSYSTKSYYYRTPLEFFKAAKQSGDKADTSNGARWMLDSNNSAQRCTASGTYIFLPAIPSKAADGSITTNAPIRLRYPIMPIASEGNAMWKRTDAVADMLLDETENHSNVKISLKDEISAAAGCAGTK